ncbi:unnamed protein product, partial [Rangifer tarandus platyrhynchus]
QQQTLREGGRAPGFQAPRSLRAAGRRRGGEGGGCGGEGTPGGTGNQRALPPSARTRVTSRRRARSFLAAHGQEAAWRASGVTPYAHPTFIQGEPEEPAGSDSLRGLHAGPPTHRANQPTVQHPGCRPECLAGVVFDSTSQPAYECRSLGRPWWPGLLLNHLLPNQTCQRLPPAMGLRSQADRWDASGDHI